MSDYRPDIDGLRAFAILSVILYHLGFGLTRGGFIGVDIFFVISGFLITGIIKREIDCTGRFHYTHFYIRRIRRLFPALFVTVTVTLMLSIFLFSSSHLERLGGSTIHALSSLSNFYFWAEAGYFDSAAGVKPLLHTWSLSVEEQFYLLWPFLFVFVMKVGGRCLLIFTLSGMMALSLCLNDVFQDGHVNAVREASPYVAELISDGRSTIFYLLPFRLYEFIIGGMLIFVPNNSVRNWAVNEIMIVAGIMMLIYSFFAFSRHTLFPSFNALIPCIGTACIIYSGNKTVLGRALSHDVLVGLGKISYSLYLVHWPIIVFWRYFTFEKISLAESVPIVIVSILVAMLMYKTIEQPFRLKRHGVAQNSVASFGVVTLVIGSFVIVLAANIWVNKGWPWRINTPVSAQLVPPEVKEVVIEVIGDKTKWTSSVMIGDKKDSTTAILVLGDSHAAHLQGGARYLSDKYSLSFVFSIFTGCPPIFGTYKVYGAPDAIKKESLKQIKCRDQTEIWEKYVRNHRFDYVMLGARWNWLFEPQRYYDTKQRRDLLVDKKNRKFTTQESMNVFSSYLDYTVKAIHASGARAIVFGQVPHVGKNLDGCGNVPRLLISDANIVERCNHVPRAFVLQRSKFSNDTIRHIASINNAISVIPTDFFCAESTTFCKTIHDGTILKNDDDHINAYGSVYLARLWEKSTDFPFQNEGRPE